MTNAFSAYHPAVNFLYFSAILLFSMFFMHPAFLGISFLGAFTYSLLCNGKKAVKFNLRFLLPMLVLISVMNPVFNHAGATILVYLNDNPVTLESIVYGIAAAVMFSSVILWFSCYNAVMTSDKFVFLFSRIIPSLSMVFSMCLRFVPKFKVQFSVTANAQSCIGKGLDEKRLVRKIKNAVRIFSVMVTWALESAVETADSMKSRGYGLKGRTSFSMYRPDRRDIGVGLLMLLLIGVIAASGVSGAVDMQYFPSVRAKEGSPLQYTAVVCYAVFCFLPVLIHLVEELKWRSLQSKI